MDSLHYRDATDTEIFGQSLDAAMTFIRPQNNTLEDN